MNPAPDSPIDSDISFIVFVLTVLSVVDGL